MKTVFIFILVIAFTYGAGQWLSQHDVEQVSVRPLINISSCDPAKQVCKFDNKELSYDLQFKGGPSGLVPFVVLINMYDNTQPDSIELSFDMDGMDMGYNLHNLVKNKNIWQAKVILPVCSLGRNDWLLNVKMKFENKIVITKFEFQQPG